MQENEKKTAGPIDVVLALMEICKEHNANPQKIINAWQEYIKPESTLSQPVKSLQGCMNYTAGLMRYPHPISLLVRASNEDKIKYVEKVAELYAQSQQQSQWVSVETPPEVSGKYLTYSADYHKVGHAWYNNKYSIGWEDDKENTLTVTHWMPLPTPPKTK